MEGEIDLLMKSSTFRRIGYCFIIMAFIAVIVHLIMGGWEVDPHISTYQRNKTTGENMNLTEEYSAEEYEEIVFSDQPDPSDEYNFIRINVLNHSVVSTSEKLREDLREVLRNKIEDFAHAWIQHGYTYSDQQDYDKVSRYLTPSLSRVFLSECMSQLKNEVTEKHVLMDIRSISYYDGYCRKYIADGDKEIIRIKAEITVRRSGDEGYFIKHPNVNRGDTSHELYFYFECSDQMSICAIYERTHIKNGNYKCWYTEDGIFEDTSEMMVDEFESMTANEYLFITNNVSIPTSRKKAIYHKVNDFISSFFDSNKGMEDLNMDLGVDIEALKSYEELKNAIVSKEVVRDKNYVSYSLEMAFLDLSLYECNQEYYYVVKESVMLDSFGVPASKEKLNYIETGLWKYSIYFVFRADDSDYHIIRIEIKPDSGPYESAGDVDEG